MSADFDLNGRWIGVIKRVLALAILGVGALWPRNGDARTPTHVACVGDSITYGYMASSPSASYPSDLQKKFGSAVNVMNFGHSAATMLSMGDTPYLKQSEYTAATSFVSGAGASATVAVVIMLGTNDTKPQNWMSGSATHATQFQTDAAGMVDHFAQLGTHPTVYLAIPPRAYTNTYGIDGTILLNQVDPILRDVAASKGLATIDLDAPTANHPELFSDGVHPTDTGYALVAMIVHDALVNGGGGAGGAPGRGGAGGMKGGGSGGASGSGTGGGSGGSQTGGMGAGGTTTATGGNGTGGAGTAIGGTSGAGTGGVATGGTGTGGARIGSGGASSGGAPASATGGTGGSGTGGSSGGNETTDGASSGCACTAGSHDRADPWPGAISFFFCFVLLRAHARRKR